MRPQNWVECRQSVGAEQIFLVQLRVSACGLRSGSSSKMTLMTSGSHFGHWLLGVITSLTLVEATTLNMSVKERPEDQTYRLDQVLAKLWNRPLKKKQKLIHVLIRVTDYCSGNLFDCCFLCLKGKFSQTATLETFTTHRRVSGGREDVF